ncbi:hypothetical protein ANCCEY_14155 [Ancylostoma ceylanicum]|uniref:Uncharacterized protein n=1 Tax=Ancylostoma ceylanicum TaxID=53326 RepID=A0A0D6L751_9BILA|nr:hypothetical protein ANCCEY_14155 [Ancylostoma ceylanicum]
MVNDSLSAPAYVQKSAKRLRGAAQDSLLQESGDLGEAVALLLQDANVPPYLKTILGHVLEDRDRYAAKEVENEQKNRELALENAKLRSEIDTLKAALALSRNNTPNAKASNSHSSDLNSFEEKERLRSVVISGVPESSDPCASNPTSGTSKEFLEMCESHDSRQYVTESTRGDHTLDVVLCNGDHLIGQLEGY